jgi:hypothetical protein
MEEGLHDDIPPPPPRPRTMTVVAWLMSAAMLISWLAAYALPNALVAAELMSPWTAGADPRPWWLVCGFILMTTVFGGLFALFRWTSQRQFHKLGELADVEES